MRHVYGVRRGNTSTSSGVNSPHTSTSSPKSGRRDRSWRTRARSSASARVGNVASGIDVEAEVEVADSDGGAAESSR